MQSNIRGVSQKSDPKMQGKGSKVTLHRVDVGGVGALNVLIDSGFKLCVISGDLLTGLIVSQKIKPMDGALTLFDGSKVDVVGIVELDVSYLGKKVVIDFYVVKELYDPVILGANWIHKTGAILQSDGTKLRVTFGEIKEQKGSKTKDPEPCSVVSVHLDGFGVISALVSTGSGRSSIRRGLLTELQMSKAIPASNLATTIANGKQVKIQNLLNLNLTFEGMKTSIENVPVIPETDTTLVLGMDWIHKTRVVIQSDGSKLVVSKPKKKKDRIASWLSKKLNPTHKKEPK